MVFDPHRPNNLSFCRIVEENGKKFLDVHDDIVIWAVEDGKKKKTGYIDPESISACSPGQTYANLPEQPPALEKPCGFDAHIKTNAIVWEFGSNIQLRWVQYLCTDCNLSDKWLMSMRRLGVRHLEFGQYLLLNTDDLRAAFDAERPAYLTMRRAWHCANSSRPVLPYNDSAADRSNTLPKIGVKMVQHEDGTYMKVEIPEETANTLAKHEWVEVGWPYEHGVSTIHYGTLTLGGDLKQLLHGTGLDVDERGNVTINGAIKAVSNTAVAYHNRAVFAKKDKAPLPTGPFPGCAWPATDDRRVLTAVSQPNNNRV